MIALDNDRAATLCADLYRYFRKRAFAHEDSEDLVQDVMVRIARRATQFESEAHLRAYLFVTARNVATDAWRRRRPADAELDDIACRDPDPSSRVQIRELATLWRHKLGEIDPSLVPFFDPDAEAPSYTEMAATSGRREAALRTAVCRARKRLRADLADVLAA